MTTALTATVQAAYGRVQLQLTWTTVTVASIARVHADGSQWPLRDATLIPILSTTGVGAVVYDNELPVDQAVTYLATSPQTSTTFTSSPVTLASDPSNVGSMVWLTHPLKPALSMLVCAEQFGEQALDARAGILQILGSGLAVAVTDSRVVADSTLTVTTVTAADAAALQALLADGQTLLMRPPGAWLVPWQYVAVGKVTRVATAGYGTEPTLTWTLPYTVVAAPAGSSQGATGDTWADVITNFGAWATVTSARPTWAALMAG